MIKYFWFIDRRDCTPWYRDFPTETLALGFVGFLAALGICAYFLLDPMFLNWYTAGYADKSGIFALTTDLGKSNWILISLGLVLIVSTLHSCDNLGRAPRLFRFQAILSTYFVFTAVAFSGLLAILLKNLIGRARPILHEHYELWFSQPFTDPYAYASFPSGHSTTAAAVAMAVALLFPRIKWLCLAFGLWIGFSRIAVGAHFPSDVIAGLALGAGFTWIYARSFARKRLLFEYDEKGKLRCRNRFTRLAHRKIRKSGVSYLKIGFPNWELGQLTRREHSGI